jgi:hypothetical protein
VDRVCLVDSETVQNLQFPLYRATGDIVKVSIQALCPILYFRKLYIPYFIVCTSVD